MGKSDLNKIYSALEPLLDSDIDDIKTGIIRLISNQIGAGKEWADNDYVSAVSLKNF